MNMVWVVTVEWQVERTFSVLRCEHWYDFLSIGSAPQTVEIWIVRRDLSFLWDVRGCRDIQLWLLLRTALGCCPFQKLALFLPSVKGLVRAFLGRCLNPALAPDSVWTMEMQRWSLSTLSCSIVNLLVTAVMYCPGCQYPVLQLRLRKDEIVFALPTSIPTSGWDTMAWLTM